MCIFYMFIIGLVMCNTSLATFWFGIQPNFLKKKLQGSEFSDLSWCATEENAPEINILS